MDGFSREVIGRLPLAGTLLSLFSWITEPQFLKEIFEQHRGRSFELDVSFSTW